MFTNSIYDLHTHSTASDGALTPTALVERAASRGIKVMALTDHDCVLGVSEAQAAGEKLGVQVVAGSELSITWNNMQIHIAGLFLDINAPKLVEYLKNQRVRRVERAKAIAEKLERQGIHNAYERTLAMAGENANITRGSYARFIFSIGQAQSTDDAFNSYLRKGKSCYVKTQWPDIATAVSTIKAAGGIAVLAHPKRYLMTNMKLRSLIEDFKAVGGEAMEVSSCSQSPSERDYLAKLSLHYELLASLGSDFHAELSYRDLGRGLALPDEVNPVWKCPQAEAMGIANLGL